MSTTRNFGIKKAKLKDPRQFKFHKTFGTFPITAVPDTFDFGTVPLIKDQGATYFCTAFSGSYVVGHCEQVDSSAEYLAQKTIRAANYNPANFTGTTPQLADKVMVKYGTIAQSLSPFTFGEDDPVALATPSNWPASLDAQAKKPIGASFELTSDGYIDLFDAIRATLFFKKTLPVRLAVFWQPQWTSANGGVITADMVQNFQEVNGHSLQADPAVVIKNGVQYLRVPNSWGTQEGDNGYYYFSREAVNKTFYVSAYDPAINPVAVKDQQWSVWVRIFDALVSVWRAISGIFK